jgi:hypothetical protein
MKKLEETPYACVSVLDYKILGLNNADLHRYIKQLQSDIVVLEALIRGLDSGQNYEK